MSPDVTPPLSQDTRATRNALARLAQRYHRMGWLFGTSGNLSARVITPTGPRVVITASGCDKGDLSADDFVEISPHGDMLGAGAGKRPSAETSIHLAVYDVQPATHAVLHVHTIASTQLVMPQTEQGKPGWELKGYEMIKGWGRWEKDATALFPAFTNHPHVPDIASDVTEYLRQAEEPVPALLIARHGLTAWGSSIFEAHRHLEVAEFFCRLLAAGRAQMGTTTP